MMRYAKISLVATLAIMIAVSLVLAKSSRRSENAWLGVYTQSVDYDLAEAFDLTIKYGAIVNEVVEDSPAEEAGIEEGDVIIKFDGFRITASDDLSDMVEDGKSGDKASVVLMRDGEQKELDVILGKRPRRLRSQSRSYSDWPQIAVPPIPSIRAIPKIRAPQSSYYYSYGNNNVHGHIGVTLSSLSKQLGEYFGVEKGRGALITEIEEDSPAEEAGLKAGDVIVDIDGEKIHDPDDAVEIVHEMDEGEKVKVTVMRNKSETSFDVEIIEEEGNGVYIYSDDDSYSTVTVPRIRIHNKHGSLFDDHDFDFFDSDDFLEGMEDLRESLEDLKREDFLNDDTFKRDRVKLKRELKQLQKELIELQSDLE